MQGITPIKKWSGYHDSTAKDFRAIRVTREGISVRLEKARHVAAMLIKRLVVLQETSLFLWKVQNATARVDDAYTKLFIRVLEDRELLQ